MTQTGFERLETEKQKQKEQNKNKTIKGERKFCGEQNENGKRLVER